MSKCEYNHIWGVIEWIAQDSWCLKDIEKLNKVKECDFNCGC